MFENVVRSVLLYFLGRYIKGIEVDKLNYRESSFNDLEFNLEAINGILQLPLALKEGRIGKLSIKIPWKLGWAPIEITVENVFMCACRWDDQEWSREDIEKRELAAKKAKLAAAELAKLTSRVCDSTSGIFSNSYFMAKILDNIQLSVKNLYVLYLDSQGEQAKTVLGLRFSSLTMLKKNPIRSVNGNLRGSQLHMNVEILGLEIFCGSFKECQSKRLMTEQTEGDKFNYIVAPVDVSMSLLINGSGTLENDAPQFLISAESTKLVISLDEVQLQQIFMLWDNMCISRIREKYGRYRPWTNLLSQKLNGWQIAWWHYAQQSVLLDVRKKLKKTSWIYFRERLKCCRKYVNLYKTKLELQRNQYRNKRVQTRNEDLFCELEEMEKEFDIEDILSYRSAAEYELQYLQDSSLNLSSSNMGGSGTDTAEERLHGDERSATRLSGWWNWVQGIMAANGDSGQFSGLVSDDVVRDIREVTDFDPGSSHHGEAAANDRLLLSTIKFSVPQIIATLRSMEFDQEIAELTFGGIMAEFKLWEHDATTAILMNAVEIAYPRVKKVILHAEKKFEFGEHQPSVTVQIDVSHGNQHVELLVKVVVQLVEVTLDFEFLSDFVGFYTLFKSFEFNDERVLSSLNGIENVQARLLSKAEYIISSRNKVIWDIGFMNTVVRIPWTSAFSELYEVVLECGSLFIVSKRESAQSASCVEDELYLLNSQLNSVWSGMLSPNFQLQDLYDHLEVKSNDTEIRVIMPQDDQLTILEKFKVHMNVVSCIIPDESILKQLQVFMVAPSFHASLSPSILGAILGLKSHVIFWLSKLEAMPVRKSNLLNVGPRTPMVFPFSVIAKLDSFFCSVDLLDDKEHKLRITLALHEVDVRYGLLPSAECCICLKALEVLAEPLNSEEGRHVLCSSGNLPGHSSQKEFHAEITPSADACFLFHYEVCKSMDLITHKCTVLLNDVELHCYPYIVGSLVQFFDQIPQCDVSCIDESPSSPLEEGKTLLRPPAFALQRFGFSNFSDVGSSELASIPLHQFPFVTIYNNGCLTCLETSLIHGIPEWRKYFKLRDMKIGIPKASFKRRFKFFHSSTMKYLGRKEDLLTSSDSGGTDIFVTDLDLTGIRVHLHNSSCIFASLVLPNVKSSISISEDCLDILCSTEKMTLSSSWWSYKLQEFLWGPLSPNFSPVFNMRLRKAVDETLSSILELSISIQHVSCILPPEFLAVIIGYFSLPEWRFGARDEHFAVNLEASGKTSESSIVYKFEILDSALLVPVKSGENMFLKLDLRQFYCSFFRSSSVPKDIPPECRVSEHKISGEANNLNIFGQGLSFLLILLRSDANDMPICDENIVHKTITLIAPLSVDVWVRIPCKNESFCIDACAPTCVMVRIQNCQLTAEEHYAFHGFEAILDVSNKFCSVGEESKYFTADVLQFLHFRKGLEAKIPVLNDTPNSAVTEIKCSVNSLSIKLGCTCEQSSIGLVAQTDMQFSCAVSLNNDILLSLKASFSSLELYSLVRTRVLARLNFISSCLSVLDILFLESGRGGNDLRLSLPSLEVWLHLPDWIDFSELVGSYIGHYSGNSVTESSPKNMTIGSIDAKENVALAIVSEYTVQSPPSAGCSAPENILRDTPLNIMLENVGITFHVSVQDNMEASCVLTMTEVEEGRPRNVSSSIPEAYSCKCMKLTLHTGSTELVMSDSSVKLTANVEKIFGSIVICEGYRTHSWPFFQLFQVRAKAEICDLHMQPLVVKADIQSDGLDVWLSHQVFSFWHGTSFEISEAGQAQYANLKICLQAQISRVSLLLTDGRWSCNGPLMEILFHKLLLHAKSMPDKMEGSLYGELHVNYNNNHKVLWEPFIEPWEFQFNMLHKNGKGALLNSNAMTEAVLLSTGQLNLNFTESLIEVAFRTVEMIKDAWGSMHLDDFSANQNHRNHQNNNHMCTEIYAPYILQNLTSLPLVFHMCKGQDKVKDLHVSMVKDGELVEPGSSIPLYVDDTPEQHFSRFRTSQSSDRLNEMQSDWVAHHYISVQLDGTSMPSPPISMDLVGLTYFEVDFSNPSNLTEATKLDHGSNPKKIVGELIDVDSSFIVPVVVEVSVQRYSKLVRLYSTVIIVNATSVPVELRFDIPFGVSPKILDPVYPGQEFPLPLHLAEAGRMRWRPLGSTHLWSEAHILSYILSQGNKIGNTRSFVCYPSHSSGDPFRCCLAVQDISLGSSGTQRKVSASDINSLKCSVDDKYRNIHTLENSKKRCIHFVTLTAPLVVKNFLPEPVSLIIKSGGVTRNAILTEVETSFFHVDSSHDLETEFCIGGYKSSTATFQRSETFCALAKFVETKFTIMESMIFHPDSCAGHLHVTVEKAMDAFSGARELCISVPFLLYNCVGFPLIVSDGADELRDACHTVPSCYKLDEQEFLCKKDGLGLFSSVRDASSTLLHSDALNKIYPKTHIVSSRTVNSDVGLFLSEPSMSSNNNANKCDVDAQNAASDVLIDRSNSNAQSKLEISGPARSEHAKVKPYMYSPSPNSSSNEIMVRVSRYLPGCSKEKIPICSWSECVSLVPPTGITSVPVPWPAENASYLLSLASSSIGGPLLGRTTAVTFQPRYVISNSCSKNLLYKQKGTDLVLQLKIGKHSHLHWMDATRDLLVSVCFDGPGWEWSGSFMPEDLGDTQVKMRNYDTGALNMIRVEVQNADISTGTEKILGRPNGHSGTYLVLLSDDDTGFMPYRIDNFTKERLRIYQQKCETFAAVVYPYTSCPYAWDEPCYPHRLAVEVPGERVVGSYCLDDGRDFLSVKLASTSEKPARTFFVSVRAEGAMKVLSIIDTSCHILHDVKDQSVPWFRDRRENNQKQDACVDYKEKISVVVPFIGISLIDSSPKELVFACAKNIAIDFLQTPDQQKFSFQISSLQIDNQLQSTYPVILFFDPHLRSNPADHVKMKDSVLKSKGETVTQFYSDASYEPVFCLEAARWRNNDISLVSFKHISLRMAEFHLELDQEVVFGLFTFSRTVISRTQGSRDSSSLCFSHSMSSSYEFAAHAKASDDLNAIEVPVYPVAHMSTYTVDKRCDSPLPSVVPIGAPWQQIYLLARRQEKVYFEDFNLAPIKFTLSFSSTPWLLRNGILASGDSLLHRRLIALADVEGAKIHLKQLTIAHHMASWDSIMQILIRHYTRQILHEMYKIFGSAGVIGNPMGFARSLALGIQDFLSVPARSILQSPTGLITGMAQGTTSLLSSTVYALSDAATQFSKAAQKGIVAFTFDDLDIAKRETQQMSVAVRSKGVINEFLQGLTGLLQSPIRGAEKHGLLGVFSGIALGVTGLVARPAAGILEVTGKTAQSIRNRSKLHQTRSQRFRIRLPRPLSRDLPLKPYSFEEAVAACVLAEADEDSKFKDEVLIVCKELKQGGKFALVTERLLMVVGCSSLVGLGSPEFKGVAAEPEWDIEEEIGLENVIHADADGGLIHIVGSNSDASLRKGKTQQKRGDGTKQWSNAETRLPLFHINLEFACKEEAIDFIQILLSAIESGKERSKCVSTLLRQMVNKKI